MERNIAFLCSTLRRTGPTQQLHYILEGLDRTEFHPRVITLSKETADSMIEEFDALKVPVICLELRRWVAARRGSRLLQQILKNYAIDLVHSQGIRSDSLVHHIGTSFKSLITIRNDPKKDYPMKYGNLMGLAMAQRHLNVLRAATVVSCSRSLQDRLKNYQINTRRIENGVKVVARSHEERHRLRRELRQSLGVPDSVRVAICVGSLITRKNIEAAIRGLRQMSDHAADVVLLIVGDGPERKRLSDIAAGDQRIRFLGFSSEVSNLLEAADFFVSTSHSEGLPNSVLEALSAGLPCLLSSIPPHEELAEASSLVSLFSVQDSGEIARMMSETVRELEGFDISTRYSRGLPREFSAATMSSKYQSLYREIINS
jgi:glycosyltransferase involved in cell wall biosynthesis